jgi:type II restriction enzyme
MDIQLDATLAASFKSRSQIARVVTEGWAARNLFCLACVAPSITQSLANTRAVDFACGSCGAAYQLKSGVGWGQRVPDAGYNAMIAAIRSDNVPNLLVMQYSREWRVRNLILIPSFFFTEAAIEKRKPLGPSARRAGWVGCNINLGAISPEGKVRIVVDEIPVDPDEVRLQYQRVKPISALNVNLRGWALSVLNYVHRLGTREFRLADIYAFEDELSALYPRNRNVRPKIRQQLQVLRDLGLIRFLGYGTYSLC